MAAEDASAETENTVAESEVTEDSSAEALDQEEITEEKPMRLFTAAPSLQKTAPAPEPLIKITKNPAGAWRQNSTGWWFRYPNGSYPKNEWIEVKNKTYHFDSNGYMSTGWVKDNNHWFYCDSSGAMVKSAWVGNYYLDSDGVMATSRWINQYFVGADGEWIPNYGVGRWVQDSVGWWYNDGYGSYYKNGFHDIKGKTYYFNRSGYMETGWVKINGYWYYFNSDGAMKKNAWEGNYWLLADGKMAVNTAVDNGKYYVGADGAWIPGWSAGKWVKDSTGWGYNDGRGSYYRNGFYDIDGKTYYFNSAGYMQTGWQRINGNWYYFHGDGAMARNANIDGYYVGSDGIWDSGETTSDLVVASGVSSAGITMRGIDVSEHNGDIDLSQYIGEFVIIRIGYWTTPDKRAIRNMDLCDKYNIPYGVYLYDYTTEPADAVKEAEFTLKMIKGRNVRCGVWFDMEDADGWKHRNGLDPTDPRITQICQKYCDTIRAAGYHVGIYASYSWFGTYIKDYQKYDVWVAHWGANDGKMNINLSNMASLHQYTSIPLDKNVMYVPLSNLK